MKHWDRCRWDVEVRNAPLFPCETCITFNSVFESLDFTFIQSEASRDRRNAASTPAHLLHHNEMMHRSRAPSLGVFSSLPLCLRTQSCHLEQKPFSEYVAAVQES